MLTSVMNNTKWDELRLAMHSLPLSPAWNTVATNGFQSHADRDWFYHFRIGGYECILYVNIYAENEDHRELIRHALQSIHLPGDETPEGFRIYGYLSDGQVTNYI